MPLSEHYRKQLAQLHAKDAGFGGRWPGPNEDMLSNMRHLNVRSMLDYGCGKALWYEEAFKDYPPLDIHLYDPAWTVAERTCSVARAQGHTVTVHESEHSLVPVDMVICRHVLEHVEPEHVPDTWKLLFSLFKRTLCVEIGLGDSIQTLADGRNAHLTNISPTAWLAHAVAMCMQNTRVRIMHVNYLPTRSYLIVFKRIT